MPVDDSAIISWIGLATLALFCYVVALVSQRRSLRKQLQDATDQIARNIEAEQILRDKFTVLDKSSHEITQSRDALQSEIDILGAQANAMGRKLEQCADIRIKESRELNEIIADREGQLKACRAANENLRDELDHLSLIASDWRERHDNLQVQLEDVGLKLRDIESAKKKPSKRPTR